MAKNGEMGLLEENGERKGNERKEVKAANFAILKGAPIKRSSVIAVILTKSFTSLKLKFPVFLQIFSLFC